MDAAQAQTHLKVPPELKVTSDGTLSTKVQTDGNNFVITEGTQVGENLFHSFEQFSIPYSGSARFANQLDIQNIFGRVTGNNISQIEGLIKTNGTANLFLINPNGIIFGNNAQLNVGGSFIASTANQIDFAGGNDISFIADRNITPLLTANIPIGLNFRENSGKIINRSTVNRGFGLQISSGDTLALIGSNVVFEGGNITSIGGRIEVGSVASPAYVSLIPISQGWKLNYDGVQEFHDITLSGGAKITTALLDEGSGDVFLQGKNILITGISEVLSTNLSENLGGTITIKANQSVQLSEDSDIKTSTAPASMGTGGNIIIETKQLLINDKDSFIQSVNQGLGRGGDVIIKADDLIEIDGTQDSNGISTGTFFPNEGVSGDIVIETNQLILKNGGSLSGTTNRSGSGGIINIDAKFIDISGKGQTSDGTIKRSGIFSRTIRENTIGNAGAINIDTQRLQITDGGRISVASAQESQGSAGSVTIYASEFLKINGSDSALLSTSDGLGIGGDLRINTPRLIVQEGAKISASSPLSMGGSINLQGLETLQINNSNISASTETGRAGNLTVKAESIQLNGTGGLSVEATEGGTAGNLTVETSQMSIFEGAKVTVTSLQGQAGNLTINANSLSLNRGFITAETGKSETGEGANISLNLSDLLRIENESLISATANGSADGGNIDIDTPSLVVFPPKGLNGSDIIAKAEKGSGGRIAIDAQGIFGIRENLATPGNQSNDLDASSESGSTGEIVLNRELDPNRGLVELPETVVDPNALIAQNACKRGSKSEFVITGRGGLPPSLSEDLNSEATQVGLVEPAPMIVGESKNREISENQGFSASVSMPIVPAQGWVFNEKGDIILVAYDPTVTGSQRLRENEKRCPSP